MKKLDEKKVPTLSLTSVKLKEDDSKSYVKFTQPKSAAGNLIDTKIDSKPSHDE